MKVSEVRERTDEELIRLSGQLRKDYFVLRVKQATNQLEDAGAIRRLRRDIARVETIRQARQMGLEASKAQV